MWFAWDGTNLLMTQTRDRQKLKNVTREARIALSIVDPTHNQRYLELRGVVDEVRPDPGAAFYQSLRERYRSTATPIRDADRRVILVIRPTAIYGRTGSTVDRPPRIVRGRRVRARTAESSAVQEAPAERGALGSCGRGPVNQLLQGGARADQALRIAPRDPLEKADAEPVAVDELPVDRPGRLEGACALEQAASGRRHEIGLEGARLHLRPDLA